MIVVWWGCEYLSPAMHSRGRCVWWGRERPPHLGGSWGGLSASVARWHASCWSQLAGVCGHSGLSAGCERGWPCWVRFSPSGCLWLCWLCLRHIPVGFGQVCYSICIGKERVIRWEQGKTQAFIWAPVNTRPERPDEAPTNRCLSWRWLLLLTFRQCLLSVSACAAWIYRPVQDSSVFTFRAQEAEIVLWIVGSWRCLKCLERENRGARWDHRDDLMTLSSFHCIEKKLRWESWSDLSEVIQWASGRSRT